MLGEDEFEMPSLPAGAGQRLTGRRMSVTTELYCSSFMKPFSGEKPLPDRGSAHQAHASSVTGLPCIRAELGMHSGSPAVASGQRNWRLVEYLRW